jgi:hypothetical protein
MVLVESKHDKDKDNDSQDYKSEHQGSGRVFPLLPPYEGVDFTANFNKLKSSGDAGYFVVRDSIVVSYGEKNKGANMFYPNVEPDQSLQQAESCWCPKSGQMIVHN